MKSRFLPNIFNALHNEILLRFQNYCEREGIIYPPPQYQLYGGYGGYNPMLPSIKSLMEEHDEVKKFLKIKSAPNINGYQLYDCYRKYKGGDAFIEISQFYVHVYMLFLGFLNKEQFLNKIVRTKYPQWIPEIERQLQMWKHDLSSIVDPISDYTVFNCYYYSLPNHIVKAYQLKIDFNYDLRSKLRKKLPVFKAVAIFKSQYSKKGEYIFSGYATISGQYLQIDLRSDDRESRVAHIITRIGVEDPENKMLMVGSYLSIGAATEIISGEVLMMQLDGSEEISEEKAIAAEKYIHATNTQLRIPLLPHDHDISSLLEQRFPLYHLLDRAVGTYKLFYPGSKGSLVESICYIQSNFRITLNTYNYKYTGQVSISDKIFDIIMYRGAERKIYKMAKIYVPRPGSDEFFEGQIILTGSSNNPLAKKCLLIKTQDDAEPARYPDAKNLSEEASEAFQRFVGP